MMALKVMVNHKGSELIFDVMKQENDVYCLRKSGGPDSGKDYIPQKIIIRRKGKIWISDVENHLELMGLLIAEVTQLSVMNEITTDE
jgi:hypothetical protein